MLLEERTRMTSHQETSPLEGPFLVDITKLTVGSASTGKLIRKVHDSFIVDAFIGNAADWERVCMGNLVGMPVPIHHFFNVQALAVAMAYQSMTDQ
ncbi:unnamed protein product, partial [Prunus brigantina]